MKFYKVTLLVLFTGMLNGQISQAQDSIPLGLNAAIQLALDKNTSITTANYQVNTVEFALKEAKGNFLPKLHFNANYNRNIDRQVIFLPENFGIENRATKLGSDNEFRSALNLSLPLYSNYNFSNKYLAETTLKFQNEVSRGVKQSVINSTKKAYLNCLIVQEVIKVQQNSLENAQENLRNIQQRYQRGTLTDYDLASAKVQVALAKNNLLEAQSNSIPTINNLKLLLGLKNEDAIKFTAPISLLEEELVLEDSADQLLEKNSKLKQLEIAIQQKENQLKIAKSSYYPTLDAVGNYYYQAQSNDFDVLNYDWVNTSLAGLQLQWSIFNGTITKNKVEQAIIAKKIAEEEKEYTTREYKMRRIALLSMLDFYKQKIEVQKESMALTSEALTLSRKRYRFGVGTFLEINDAELSYTQARLNWLQTLSDYQAAYYDYQLLIGKE
ncbi:MAG TPA: TolC family protein [Lutibacter sp.]